MGWNHQLDKNQSDPIIVSNQIYQPHASNCKLTTVPRVACHECVYPHQGTYINVEEADNEHKQVNINNSNCLKMLEKALLLMFLSLFVKHTNYIQLHYIAFLLAALEVPKREASLGSNAISVANLWRHRFGLDLRDSLRIFYGILTNCANRFVADLREKAYGFFTDFLRILYGILTNCANRFVADLREKAYGFFTDSLRNSHDTMYCHDIWSFLGQYCYDIWSVPVPSLNF